jgi:hypothetical protein
MANEHLSELHLVDWRAFRKVYATVVGRIDHDLVAYRNLPLSPQKIYLKQKLISLSSDNIIALK